MTTIGARWGSDNEIFHQPRQVIAFDVQQVRRPLGVKHGVFERLAFPVMKQVLKPQA